MSYKYFVDIGTIFLQIVSFITICTYFTHIQRKNIAMPWMGQVPCQMVMKMYADK